MLHYWRSQNLLCTCRKALLELFEQGVILLRRKALLELFEQGVIQLGVALFVIPPIPFLAAAPAGLQVATRAALGKI